MCRTFMRAPSGREVGCPAHGTPRSARSKQRAECAAAGGGGGGAPQHPASLRRALCDAGCLQHTAVVCLRRTGCSVLVCCLEPRVAGLDAFRQKHMQTKVPCAAAGALCLHRRGRGGGPSAPYPPSRDPAQMPGPCAHRDVCARRDLGAQRSLCSKIFVTSRQGTQDKGPLS